MAAKKPNIERIAKEGMMFTDWYGQQSCTAGALVAKYMQTMLEFPPRQSPESWTPEQMMEKLNKNAETLKAAAHPG